MKITNVSTYPVKHERRAYLVVVVDTDEGIAGYGEAGLSSRDHAVIGAVAHLADLINGEDPFRTERLWQLMWRAGFFPAQGAVASAVAAIDIALWDIKGKALGQPVYNLLGGKVRDSVPSYIHIGPDEKDKLDGVIEMSQQRVAEGWRHLRYAVVDDKGILEPITAARDTLHRLQKIREVLGDDVELLLDVHTRLGLPESVWLANELSSVRLFFYEDPLRAEYPEQYRQLRQRTSIPIAAGEQFSSKWEFRSLIEQDLIDYARIDLCIAGGITEAVKIAALCETHNLRIATHNPLGPISTAACLHFNTALTPFGIQEQPFVPGLTDRELFPVQQGTFDGGAFTVSDTPGLGVEFDRAAAENYLIGRYDIPVLYRRDGSYTNW